MSASDAERLLRSAARADDQLTRHLLVAAALREVFRGEAVVVGGTAELYWTRRPYHPTDLDLTGGVRREDVASLRRLGFGQDGRHWLHPEIPVAVEFPEAHLDGDMTRTRIEPVGGGAARIIGIDDLYLDRLRQATIREDAEGIEFESALAVLAAGVEEIDHGYVGARITETIATERLLGESMQRLDRKVRRRVRRSLGT